MTLAYNAVFISAWASAVLAIPCSLGLFTWLVLTAVHHGDERVGLLAGLGVAVALLVLWTIVLRFHGQRVLIRSGAFPGWCKDDAYPRDELELRQAVLDIRRRYGKSPSIVGGGWGFFLKRSGPPSPRIFTHNMTGASNSASNTWLAGTPIAKVTSELLKRELTLDSHPTMDYVSIGSWVSHSNHGNSGDLNEVHGSILDVKVLDMRSDTTQQLSYQATRRLFDNPDTREYVVLEVSLGVVPNIEVQQRGIVVEDAESAARWLAPGAHSRLLFLGAARSYGIGLRWEAPYRQTDHRDPHCCSRFSKFFQVDVFSAICGCHEPMNKFNCLTTLYEANRWMPPVYPFMTLSVVLGGIYNFEVFFKFDEILSGNLLFKLVDRMIALHKRLGGRSELRYAAPRKDQVFHLDVSLTSGFSQVFGLLHDEFGIKTVALHPGKFTDLSTAPCVRTVPYELYFSSPL